MISKIEAIDNDGISHDFLSSIQLQFGLTSWNSYTFTQASDSEDYRFTINKFRFYFHPSTITGVRVIYIGYYGTSFPTIPNNNPTTVLLRLVSSDGNFSGTYDTEQVNLSYGPGKHVLSIGIYYRNDTTS